MLPAIMAGASLLSGFMGGGSGGGGFSFPGIGGSSDTLSAGPSNALGGIGPNTLSSPFIISSGGSSVRDSGSVSNAFKQDVSPTIDQTNSTAGAKNPNNAPTFPGAIQYPQYQYQQPQYDSGMNFALPSIQSIPNSYYLIGGGIVLFVLVIALVLSSGKK